MWKSSTYRLYLSYDTGYLFEMSVDREEDQRLANIYRSGRRLNKQTNNDGETSEGGRKPRARSVLKAT